jgi:hypothetical protein
MTTTDTAAWMSNGNCNQIHCYMCCVADVAGVMRRSQLSYGMLCHAVCCRCLPHTLWQTWLKRTAPGHPTSSECELHTAPNAAAAAAATAQSRDTSAEGTECSSASRPHPSPVSHRCCTVAVCRSLPPPEGVWSATDVPKTYLPIIQDELMVTPGSATENTPCCKDGGAANYPQSYDQECPAVLH